MKRKTTSLVFKNIYSNVKIMGGSVLKKKKGEAARW